MQKKYQTALKNEGRTQKWVADKFETSRQVVNSVMRQKASKGYYGKSGLVKRYLDELVKKWEL